MAGGREPRVSGRDTTTYRSVSINLDEETFGRVLLSEKVLLRAVGSPISGTIELVLRNTVGGRIRPRGSETIVVEADEETLIGLVSPTMMVRFSGEAFSVPFETVGINSRPLFSSRPPLAEENMKS